MPIEKALKRSTGIAGMLSSAALTFASPSAPAIALVAVGIPAEAVAAAPPAEPSGDACALLTSDQVSAVLGVAVGAGQPVFPTTKALCTWVDPAGPAVVGKKLTLSLMTAPAFEAGKKANGSSKSAVSGLGDEAYYLVNGSFGAALSVKQGGRYFQVRIGGYPLERAKEMEKSLALQLLPKL